MRAKGCIPTPPLEIAMAKKEPEKAKGISASSTGGSRESGGSDPQITLRELPGGMKLKRCDFPGPRGAQSPLRVAIDRAAHADLIAHARESLNAEICGVLAGHVCEDDEGVFVHVKAAIRGAAAKQGSTHVTFTQATWTGIHEVLERDHPGLQIAGWYHSHPGFGVEFSDMDLFIQKNFFSSPTQFALVTDPLSGAVAICFNNEKGTVEYLPRFWVDGREQQCKVPVAAAAAGPGGRSVAGTAGEPDGKLLDLESRVGQLAIAVDDLRTALHRFLLFVGMVFCLAILVVAGYAVYYQLKARVEPPRNIAFAPVPVKIGEHTALLGVGVVSWELPPELDVMQQAMKELKAQLQNGTTNSTTATNAPAARTNSSSARH